ncbi:MAG: tetratricopeptide repeat protein [Candidatus Pacebacteria bacterium]|nr:tetratricopeptide repeat protein [Candidatus Paceibacterota bacterium]
MMPNSPKVSAFLEKAPVFLLLGLTFLLPVFFLPASFSTFPFSKHVLLAVCTLLAFIAWAVSSLRQGKISYTKDFSQALLALVLLVTLVSSLGFVKQSLFGIGPEIDTFGSLAIFFILFFLATNVFSTKKTIFNFYIALFASFLLVALFQVLHLFGGASFLSFSIFGDITSNLVGKWNDLGVFAGAITLLSVFFLELLPSSTFFKRAVVVALALSLVIVFLVNFPMLWAVLGIASALFLFIAAYIDKQSTKGSGTAFPAPSSEDMPASFGKMKKMVRSSLPSVLVIVLAILCIFFSDSIGSMLSNRFRIQNLEVRPSLQATYDLGVSTLKEKPIFGIGPNRFVNQWLMSKPDTVNTSVFWDTDFVYGFGFVLSSLVTIGIIGFLAWIAFLVFFVKRGIKSLRSLPEDPFFRYFILSSFVVSLYFWALNVFYVPSITTFALSFLFSGLFLGSLSSVGLVEKKDLSFSNSGNSTLLVKVLCVLLLVLSVFLGFVYGKKFVAMAMFQRGAYAFNTTGNIDIAEGYIVRAASISPEDIYYRALADIGVARLNRLLAVQNTKDKLSDEEYKKAFDSALQNTLNAADKALQANSGDYKNWILRGNIYSSLIPLKISGAYETARAAYTQAVALNPKSPSIPLLLGRLELANGNYANALDYVGKSLNLKRNFIDGYVFRGQAEVQKGDIASAIPDFENAAVIAQNNSQIFFQLGVLYYNAKKYDNAIGVLERAVIIDPSYANARYFLGLSYDKVGRVDDAITQITEIQKTNPDNQDVVTLLKNLKAEKSPAPAAKTTPSPTPKK